MKNRRLEKNKDGISDVIDDLVAAIEELEIENDVLYNQLDSALQTIDELKSDIKRLES